MDWSFVMLAKQLDVLSHRPQRQLLVELLHKNPQDDIPVGSEDPEPEGEELEVLLDFQNYYLPELDAEGFIDYDRENNVIIKGPLFEDIMPFLELIDMHRDELPDDWL